MSAPSVIVRMRPPLLVGHAKQLELAGIVCRRIVQQRCPTRHVGDVPPEKELHSPASEPSDRTYELGQSSERTAADHTVRKPEISPHNSAREPLRSSTPHAGE